MTSREKSMSKSNYYNHNSNYESNHYNQSNQSSNNETVKSISIISTKERI